MSTVYEESEPSTISIPNTMTSSLTGNTQDWLDTTSNLLSNIPLNPPNQKKSPSPSNHRQKPIDTKTRLTPIKSNTSINYEFRVQTGNESQLDGTDESVSIELINTEGQSMIIPLINSINNSKPFQKGQLDIFHLNIPNHFHHVKQYFNSLISKLYCFLDQKT
jgi:hypothetical protein